MHRFNTLAGALAGLAVIAVSAAPALAQVGITLPRVSPHAHVEQTIGLTEISIDYHRPRVNDREVWGTLVPYGQVWRAGANENTVVSFSTAVKVEGKDLAAGTYGLHMLPTEGEWTVIFSSNSTSWGSFSYTEDEDVLRVQVKPQSAPFAEWLSYGFEDLSGTAATAYVHWEEKKVPFRIEAATPEVVLANARNELRSQAGFTWQGWFQAAAFAFNNNIALDDAQTWIDRSIQNQANGNNLGLKARMHMRAGETAEAEAALAQAVEIASEQELNALGYAYLFQEQDADQAVELFTANTERHPESWNVWDSLGEGLAAAGQTAEAIQNYEKALSMAPEAQHARIEGVLRQLRS